MKLKKLLLFVFTLALFASVLFFGKAFAQPVSEPWNIVAKVRQGNRVYQYNLKQQTEGLQHQAAERGFYLGCVGKKALYNQLTESGLPPQAVREYLLPGFEKMVQFFRFVNTNRQDATVVFDAEGFHYTEGHNGISVDEEKLFLLLLNSRGNPIEIPLPLSTDVALTVSQLKQHAVPKATFTTRFAASNANRCHNICKATQAINGTTVFSGQNFSFNQTVGERTEQRGYRQSKVILDGTYTNGVGGGVCQVSTTLYNALLLSEILPKACQHTLVSSYVLAGFDAMVSDGGADLTFFNNTGYPLYIRGTTDLVNKTVTFTIYGTPNVYKVVRQSVEERTPFATVDIVDSARYPQLVYTDQTLVVTPGSDGVKSKSYLCYYQGEVLIEKKLIRQNSYKLVNKVVAHGNLQR